MALITVLSFNGFDLRTTSFTAYGNGMRRPPDASPVFLEMPMSDAVYSGTYNLGVRSVPITVTIEDWENRHELESQLKEALRPGTQGALIGQFAGSLKNHQLNCVVVSIVPDAKKDGVFSVIFQTGDSCWRAVDLQSASWSVDESGDTKTFNVGGYSPTKLSLSIMPTQLPDVGWVYQCLYQLVNKDGYAYGLRPWAITIDTATLVTAGKIQADGDDILVMIDGVISKRWLADANTATTKIWININLSEGRSLTLLTPIASSGTIGSMTFAKTSNNKAAIAALPARGYLVHGSEIFEYTGKNARQYQLTGITRAAHNTTMQAHAAGDTFSWLEHIIYVLYGNASATNPSLTDETYDDDKPVFDLSTSTNSSWVYTSSTKFLDPDKPNRTGGWSYGVTRAGDVSDVYFESGNVEGEDPAMGALMAPFYKAGVIKAEKASIVWSLTHSGGIASVSITGQKYRNSSAWPGTKAIIFERANESQNRWSEIWNEAIPSAEDTWETISHANAVITSNMARIRLSFSGSLSATAGVECYFEVLTATVNFYATNEPTGSLGSEEANYYLSAEIENKTTGEKIILSLPMVLNKSLILDSEEGAVTYDGVDAFSCLELDDESRSVWINLEPGANELEITGDNVGSLTIGLSWYERRM